MNKSIYLDYHAHAPIDPRVLDALTSAYRELDFNPHAASLPSARAKAAVEEAREKVRVLLNSDSMGIIFTSGATESNNLVFEGLKDNLKAAGRVEVIISAVEHDSVRAAAHRLKPDLKFVEAPILRSGLMDIEALSSLCSPATGLISVAAANHEIGTLQPMAQIGELAKRCGALFHSDLAQAFGRVPIDMALVDLASVSSHKLSGPGGIGALAIRKGVGRRMRPLLVGGGQEGGLRSGTVPVPLAVGFGVSCELAANHREAEGIRVGRLRDLLLNKLSVVSEMSVNGGMANRLPGNLNVCFHGVDAEALITRLKDQIIISTGSACTTHSMDPSPILLALGLDRAAAESSVRIGLGRFTTEAEIDVAAGAILDAVQTLRMLSIGSAA